MSEDERDAWEHRYQQPGRSIGEPSIVLTEIVRPHLEGRDTALDVAGGSGRHSLWLARGGLSVTLVDISSTGVQQAADAAREAGLDVHCQAQDCDVTPLPSGPWDVILCFHYLQRTLFSQFPYLLRPNGGLLFVCQPTRRNLERHPRPSPRFLLEEGELAHLVGDGLQIVHYDEGWSQEDRHEARVLARRTA